MEQIYAGIMSTEKEEKSMFEWLKSIDLHSYQIYTDAPPASSLDQSDDQKDIKEMTTGNNPANIVAEENTASDSTTHSDRTDNAAPQSTTHSDSTDNAGKCGSDEKSPCVDHVDKKQSDNMTSELGPDEVMVPEGCDDGGSDGVLSSRAVISSDMGMGSDRRVIASTDKSPDNKQQDRFSVNGGTSEIG